MGMEIGSVKTTDSMIGTQRAAAQPADAVSKSIQSKISDVERQRQGLSSKEGMSAEEKVKKRKELQQELSGLNTKLHQRQAELRKEQKREARTAELRAEASGAEDGKKSKAVEGGVRSDKKADSRAQNTEDKSADVRRAEQKSVSTQSAEKKSSVVQGKDKKASVSQSTEKTASGAEKTKESTVAVTQGKERDTSGVSETNKAAVVSGKVKASDKKNKNAGLEDVAMPEEKMRKLIAADSAKDQKKRQEAVVAKMENSIVILKGEIKQDEARGADTEQKKAQLKRQEEKVLRASSGIPTADNTSGPIGEKVQVRVEGARESSGTDVTRDGGDGIAISAASLSRELFQ